MSDTESSSPLPRWTYFIVRLLFGPAEPFEVKKAPKRPLSPTVRFHDHEGDDAGFHGMEDGHLDGNPDEQEDHMTKQTTLTVPLLNLLHHHAQRDGSTYHVPSRPDDPSDEAVAPPPKQAFLVYKAARMFHNKAFSQMQRNTAFRVLQLVIFAGALVCWYNDYFQIGAALMWPFFVVITIMYALQWESYDYVLVHNMHSNFSVMFQLFNMCLCLVVANIDAYANKMRTLEEAIVNALLGFYFGNLTIYLDAWIAPKRYKFLFLTCYIGVLAFDLRWYGYVYPTSVTTAWCDKSIPTGTSLFGWVFAVDLFGIENFNARMMLVSGLFNLFVFSLKNLWLMITDPDLLVNT